MRAPTGTVLIWTGAAVAAGGAFLLANGAWLNLSPEAVIVLAKSLPFVLGGAAMVVGAVVRRAALQAAARGQPRAALASDPGQPSALNAPPTPPTVPWRDPAPARRDAPHGPAA